MCVMLRYVLCNAILFTTMSSQHQAAMDVVPPAELYNPAIAYIGTFTHARTHAHAARPQVQAFPGAHLGMDMHDESLVCNRASKRWRFCTLH
jgi:hypothetical protein